MLTEAAAEVKSLQMDIPVVKVLIHSARGLRSTAAAAPDEGGAPPAAKEVVVTVEIEGKAGSKVTTPKIAADAEAQGSELKTVRVAFPEAEFEIKAFVTGDSLLFTVQDALTNEILGKAILTEDQLKGNFEGEVPLADAGEGYQAFLKVKLGSRHIAVATAEKIVGEVKEAIGEIKEVLGNMEGLTEKITDVKERCSRSSSSRSLSRLRLMRLSRTSRKTSRMLSRRLRRRTVPSAVRAEGGCAFARCTAGFGCPRSKHDLGQQPCGALGLCMQRRCE